MSRSNLLNRKCVRFGIFVLMMICGSGISLAQVESSTYRGSVKKIEVREYSLAGGKQTFSSLFEFSFRTDGQLESSFEYIYGIDQPAPEYRDKPEEHDNGDVFSAVILNTYDAAGRVTRSYRNERSVSKDRILVYYRDAKGNDTLVETLSLDEKDIAVLKQKFDKNGRLIAWTESDLQNERTTSTGKASYETTPAGKLWKCNKDSVSWEKASEPFTRVYDDLGRMTEEYHLNADKEKVYHFQYVYGAKAIASLKHNKGVGGVINYLYDSEGRLTSMEKLNKLGEREFIREMTYNEKGDISESKMTQAKGNISVTWQYVYEYDLQGNWIRKEEKENNTSYRIVERIITYY